MMRYKVINLFFWNLNYIYEYFVVNSIVSIAFTFNVIVYAASDHGHSFQVVMTHASDALIMFTLTSCWK